jgi:hypothetical protein
MLIILAALVAWLLPVALLWLTWRMARRSYGLLKRGVRASGNATIVNQKMSTVEYSVDGVSYRIKSWWYLPPSVGATVPVVYPPGSPERGCVNSWSELWMPPVLWLSVGVFFAILDIWF